MFICETCKRPFLTKTYLRNHDCKELNSQKVIKKKTQPKKVVKKEVIEADES